MRRFLTTASALLFLPFLTPVAALAQEGGGSKMPQMDFKNPLTGSEVVWLVIIMVALYFILSRWALPAVGTVLADRAQGIEADLNAARIAKAQADAAIAELRDAIKSAREAAQSEINTAIETAKAEAAKDAAEVSAKLDAQLAQAETQIAAARASAMAAIRPVAQEVSSLLLARLTGAPANDALLGPGLDTALAAYGQA
ncbi:F0F1 ATP synthase subunit B family protein [Acidisoma cladoniae]|jgi:F-type H+-transporting ATPase subunit b|uniref:F0F1 ATP synthase subunit B family protein n=1 Tax=Acidisoma cladoniae TaxID=3040935 RepID=UPI00254C74C3|nr:F0F1 ATP synthase subunit B [Acidisoma sp. PAMC 29798]